MKNAIRLNIMLLAFVVRAAAAGPIPWPPGWPDTKMLIEHSDLICRGTIVQLRESGPINSMPWQSRAMKVVAVASMNRCYRGGTTTSSVTISFMRPARPDMYAPALLVQRGEHGLFFLKKSASKQDGESFEFVSPAFGKVDVSSLVSEGTTANFDIEADLEAGLSDHDATKVASNIQVLAGMQNLRTKEPIKALTADRNTSIRGTAILGLLNLGDYSRLKEAICFLALPLSEDDKSLLQNPINGQFQRITDHKILPLLHDNLGSPVFLVRSAVMRAVKNIHSSESVPYLVKILDDSEHEVRYGAIFALATIENQGEWGPATDIYDKNEAKYIQHWKDWWQTEGQNKYGGH